LLVDLATEHGLFSSWGPWGARYLRVIALKSGNVGSIAETGLHEAHLTLTVGIELADALAKAGRSAEAFAMLDRLEARSPELGGFAPEFWRLRGELLLLQTAPSAAKPSENLFRQALDVALQHGALSFELRAATSLAHLLSNQGRHAEASASLQPIYDRFTEGFGTADLIAAKQLLEELRDRRNIQ
jgi:hypothetical protein